MLAIGSILPRNRDPEHAGGRPRRPVAARVVGRTTYVTPRDLLDDVLAETEPPGVAHNKSVDFGQDSSTMTVSRCLADGRHDTL